jgi:hypothetical protein
MFLSILDSSSAGGTDGLSKTVVAAVIAALGYVGKLLTDSWIKHQGTKRERRVQLIELQSLLRATKVSFQIQNAHAIRLLELLKTRIPELDTSSGYDRTLSQAFAKMNQEEQDLHAIIRSITVNSLLPGNTALLKWLGDDRYFKAQYGGGRELHVLAAKLAELQTHLILWNAKYEIWITDHPERALVYMVDEQAHGIGFPSGIDEAVANALTVI